MIQSPAGYQGDVRIKRYLDFYQAGYGVAMLSSGVAFSPLSLFANGEQGGWYDPSDLTTLFQDAAGTTPVTAVEQPVGLVLDKRNTSYSVYFDGTGDYVDMPNSSAFDVGSGSFTVECWIYNGTTGQFRHIFGKGDSSSVNVSWYFFKNSSNKLVFSVYSGFTGYSATSSSDLPLNTWTHVAFVRNGNTGTLYINGTADGTVNLTGVTVNTIGSKPTIGRAGEYTLDTWSGYISNLRMVVGTAVYTANFSVPTSPLTAISNTVLLTCGNSWTSNPVFTRGGDAIASKLNPFNTGTGSHLSQSTSTARPVLRATSRIDYDGTDDKMTAASSGGGTTGFLFVAGINLDAIGATQTIWSDTGTNTGYRVRINSSNQLELAAGNGTAYTTAVTTETLSATTNHVIAAWHDGTNLNVKLGTGGAVASQAFAAASAGSAGFTIGMDNGSVSSQLNGKLYNVVYVKNFAGSLSDVTNTIAYVNGTLT